MHCKSVRRVRRISSIYLLVLALLASCYTAAASNNTQQAPREIAITFDDLPATGPYGLGNIRSINKKLLAVINAHKIPAVGFVTGWIVEVNNERKAREEILNQWLDSGLELGNHTYTHRDLNDLSLSAFERDVVRGEAIVKPVLEVRGLKLKYFRHPYLHTGKTLQSKRALDRFLVQRGYTVAPVTHDNQEWIFSIVYDRAWKQNDPPTMKRIGALYLEYMKAMFDYYEGLSRDLFGYEIPQVLLIHSNLLNADYFPDLVRIMEERGYKFVSLDHALQDKAYQSPDTYAGTLGPSWLQRWAITRGVAYKEEPPVPAVIMERYQERMRSAR